MMSFEREYWICQVLAQRISYPTTQVTALSHTLWGDMMDGKAVCDGYAKSLMYTLNIIGIPTQMITGRASHYLIILMN